MFFWLKVISSPDLMALKLTAFSEVIPIYSKNLFFSLWFELWSMITSIRISESTDRWTIYISIFILNSFSPNLDFLISLMYSMFWRCMKVKFLGFVKFSLKLQCSHPMIITNHFYFIAIMCQKYSIIILLNYILVTLLARCHIVE